MKDRESGEVRVLTQDWLGQLGTGKTQGEPQISDDGRWIAFLYNQSLLPDLPEAWVYVYLYDRETHNLECIAPLNPKYDHYSDYYYYYELFYILIMSGDGQTLFWYQGRWEYDNVDVYRYKRSNSKIQRVVYSSEVPWQEFDPLGLFTSEGYCTNYDGSAFLFTTGSKELTPLYNQGTYQSPFTHELWPSYRLLLVTFGISSQSGVWDWLR